MDREDISFLFFFFFLFPSSAHSSAKGTIEILSFDNESSSNYFPSIRKINERKKRNKTLMRFFRAFVSKGAGVNGRTKSEASEWLARSRVAKGRLSSFSRPESRSSKLLFSRPLLSREFIVLRRKHLFLDHRPFHFLPRP